MWGCGSREVEKDPQPSQLKTGQGQVTLVSTISKVVMATNEIWQSGQPET